MSISTGTSTHLSYSGVSLTLSSEDGSSVPSFFQNIVSEDKEDLEAKSI